MFINSQNIFRLLTKRQLYGILTVELDKAAI